MHVNSLTWRHDQAGERGRCAASPASPSEADFGAAVGSYPCALLLAASALSRDHCPTAQDRFDQCLVAWTPGVDAERRVKRKRAPVEAGVDQVKNRAAHVTREPQKLGLVRPDLPARTLKLREYQSRWVVVHQD